VSAGTRGKVGYWLPATWTTHYWHPAYWPGDLDQVVLIGVPAERRVAVPRTSAVATIQRVRVAFAVDHSPAVAAVPKSPTRVAVPSTPPKAAV